MMGQDGQTFPQVSMQKVDVFGFFSPLIEFICAFLFGVMVHSSSLLVC